jgi:glycosyltransferase involved in cell wall biosynthesis
VKLSQSVRVFEKMKPAVTILIDTYNHERFIEKAIASVLEQDFPSSEMEILVIDDGSADRTPEIVRKFSPRVRLIEKPNGGQASAFNAGIPEAHGEIVAFLDGDDWWAPKKLACVVEAMETDPGVGLVGHGFVMVHLDGRQQSETLRDGFRFQADTTQGARLFCCRGSFLGTSRMTIRTDLLRRIGPAPQQLNVQADEYLFTLAAVLAGAQILPEALTYYRLHDSNAFQMTKKDPERLRGKQKALAELARCLEEQLRERRIDSSVVHRITERLQADADQLRLILDGGWPWETVETEWSIYGATHPDAPLLHLVFKLLSLMPAIAMPPQSYYAIRQRLSKSDLYLRARKRWLPIPEMAHLKRTTGTGS